METEQIATIILNEHEKGLKKNIEEVIESQFDNKYNKSNVTKAFTTFRKNLKDQKKDELVKLFDQIKKKVKEAILKEKGLIDIKADTDTEAPATPKRKGKSSAHASSALPTQEEIFRVTCWLMQQIGSLPKN